MNVAQSWRSYLSLSNKDIPADFLPSMYTAALSCGVAGGIIIDG